MTKCPKCDAATSGNQRFCSSCGADLNASWVATELGEPTGPSPSSAFSSAAEPTRFAPGDVLEGRYRVVAKLGRGGMGEVYRADDLKIGQEVALKLLPREVETDPERNRLFLNEVRLGLRVTHPNVCRLFDIVESDGFHFLSMEYVDGEDLASLLRRIGRLPSDKAVEIAQQLCAGLAAAHDVGVLHRDLKPANVMVDGRGRAKITDFGLAGATRGIEGAQARVGTPGYMAPEQLEGGELDERTDIYSLGLVLYELFTGRRAFEAGSSTEMLQMQKETTPSSLSSHVPGMDPATERAILRCLEPDPARRPASAKAVAAALPGGDPLAAAIAAGETPSPEMVAAAGDTGALRPAVAWSALAATLIIAGVLVGFLGRHQITGFSPLPKEPAVLVAAAKAMLAEAGQNDAPTDSAWGFSENSDYLDSLEKVKDPDRWQRLGTGPDSGILFWYRQSPWPLETVDPGQGRKSATDPPTDRPGMSIVWLDTEGRLVRLEAVPPELAPEEESDATIDWRPFLETAGYVGADLTPVEPRWNPPVFADSRVAWKTDASSADAPVTRIEGAAYRNRPTYFRVIAPWERPADEGDLPQTTGEKIVSVVGPILFVSVMLGGLLLALRNVRLGRSDLTGAFRITAVFVVLHTVGWALWTKHVWKPDVLISSFISSLAFTLFEGLTLYMLYLAVEPFVRRRWPDAIISWTRLLSGRFRDPLIGRDILFGSLLGVLAGLVILIETSLPGWLGDTPGRPESTNLSSLGGVRLVVGEVLDRIVHSITFPMVILVLVLLLLVVLKRQWLAFSAILILFGGLSSAFTAHWYQVPFTIVFFSIMLFALLRLGLVAAVVLEAVAGILTSMPMTADLGVWWAGGTIGAIVLLVLIAGYGFLTSLGGRSPFGEGLLGDEG
jgi:serine/threonine-protein kinase